MREQFLIELTEERLAQVTALAGLNRLFTAWDRDRLSPQHPFRDRGAAAVPLVTGCA